MAEDRPVVLSAHTTRSGSARAAGRRAQQRRDSQDDATQSPQYRQVRLHEQVQAQPLDSQGARRVGRQVSTGWQPAELERVDLTGESVVARLLAQSRPHARSDVILDGAPRALAAASRALHVDAKMAAAPHA